MEIYGKFVGKHEKKQKRKRECLQRGEKDGLSAKTK